MAGRTKRARVREEQSGSNESGDDLVQLLTAIRADLKDEYTQPHGRPWIIGFSGGKDSTLLLHLVLEMLLELPPSKRTRAVHVLSNDTLVESPVVQAFVDRMLDRVREAVTTMGLPVRVEKTHPDLEGSFWVNLIGRGYPAPNRMFRWCTDRMKIRPTTTYIREQASAAGEVILLLGVRRLESSARSKVMKRYDNGTRLNPHNNVRGCLVYRPIVDLTTEQVWVCLMQLRPPWGGSHRDLWTLYRNAQGGECPFVVDESDAPSCGTSSSRFGCWTCTVVEKDKSLMGFVDNGHEHLEALVLFRDWLQDFSRTPASRMTERRNGQEGLGPFTFEARAEILTRLREAEAEVGLPLISAREIERIEQIWKDDEGRPAMLKANRFLNVLSD
jgi:DNA sulfur modification protein DndC